MCVFICSEMNLLTSSFLFNAVVSIDQSPIPPCVINLLPVVNNFDSRTFVWYLLVVLLLFIIFPSFLQ